jgi:hypothetical protein
MVSRRALSEKDRAGRNIVSDICWGTHVCQLYHTKQDLIDVLVPYFKAGLGNNELCMWITSEPLKVYEATTALGEAVEGLDNYIKKSHIKILDQRDWYNRAGKFDAVAMLQSWLKREDLALEKGFNGLRVCAHTFDLQRRDWHNLISYESVADSVIRRHKIIAICAYSIDQCAVPDLVDIVSNHRFILLRREAKWELIDNTGHKWLNKLRIKGSSYAQIGRKLGLTRERVRQIIMGRAGNNRKVSPDDQMLTISEASKLLNLHTNTLRRWSNQDMLPCYRIGARSDRRYRRGDLIDFRRKRSPHHIS